MSAATVIMRNQICVRGGGLKDGVVMNPTLCVVDDREFIALAPGDKPLMKYMGSQEQACDFFELLKERRNAAVDELIQEMMDAFEAEHGPCKRRKIDVYDEIPRVIDVPVPPHVESGVGKLYMLAAHRRHERVWIEFTERALDYVRLGVASVDDITPRKRRRSRLDRIQVDGCPDVRFNKQRQSWWIRHRDADGRHHTKHFAWTRSDIDSTDQANREDAARKAQSEFDSLHCAPLDGTGST